MTDHDELEDLAEMLDRKAKWSDARAAMAAHDATINAQKEVVNAAYCRGKAEVCRRAAAAIRRRERRGDFIPPTLAEVQAFASEDAKCKGWPALDVEKWWNHFESNGWKVSGKTRMVNWKMAARNGCENWREKTGAPRLDAAKAVRAAKTPDDPEGWRQFLARVKVSYVEHFRAPTYLRDDFRKAAKP